MAEIVSGFAVSAEHECDEMGVGVDRADVVSGEMEFARLQDAMIGRLCLSPGAGRTDHCPAILEFPQKPGPVGTVHVWDEQYDYRL